jgi:hypothetical protein
MQLEPKCRDNAPHRINFVSILAERKCYRFSMRMLPAWITLGATASMPSDAISMLAAMPSMLISTNSTVK